MKESTQWRLGAYVVFAVMVGQSVAGLKVNWDALNIVVMMLCTSAVIRNLEDRP